MAFVLMTRPAAAGWSRGNLKFFELRNVWFPHFFAAELAIAQTALAAKMEKSFVSQLMTIFLNQNEKQNQL